MEPHRPARALPVSEAFASESLALPIGPALGDSQVDEVLAAVSAWS
jgi:dTDP-4-amino-4,6-dideoxygalactose transaminase